MEPDPLMHSGVRESDRPIWYSAYWSMVLHAFFYTVPIDMGSKIH